MVSQKGGGTQHNLNTAKDPHKHLGAFLFDCQVRRVSFYNNTEGGYRGNDGKENGNYYSTVGYFWS